MIHCLSFKAGAAKQVLKVTTDFSCFRRVKASPAHSWCINQCVKGELQGQSPAQEHPLPPLAVLSALAQRCVKLSCQWRGVSSRTCRKWSKCNSYASILQSGDAKGKAGKPDWGGSRVKKSKLALTCPCRSGTSSSRGAERMAWPFRRGLWHKRPHKNGTWPGQFGNRTSHVRKSAVYMSWV